jgi:hypothetical protein
LEGRDPEPPVPLLFDQLRYVNFGVLSFRCPRAGNEALAAADEVGAGHRPDEADGEAMTLAQVQVLGPPWDRESCAVRRFKDGQAVPRPYSHSMVAGGLLVTS